tara:strand:- start:1615 stop:2055 length:441 start_codon:yes stop_codon:yes gene_type:complete
MAIKSFRGLLPDLGSQTIRLATNDGSVGYKIKKFQLIPKTPGVITIEAAVKVYKVPQTGTPDGVIDFSDNTLLAAGYYVANNNAVYAGFETIVFDNEIFNQDIYITNFDASTGEPINYYIELEQMTLDLNQNTLVTLKDIRNTNSQ